MLLKYGYQSRIIVKRFFRTSVKFRTRPGTPGHYAHPTALEQVSESALEHAGAEALLYP
jgi:hypothetical protein